MGVVFRAAFRWGEDDLPWLFLMVAAVVIPGVGSDLALGRTVAELGRESNRRNHEPGLSKSVSVTIAAVQALGGLLLFVPFAGWVVGPLVWSMGNAAVFGRLALAEGRLARNG